MSEVVNLGKVAMTLGGDYSSSQSYDKLTCVYYDGSSWVSRKAVPEGVAPTAANSAYWQKISDRGDKGDTGAPGQSYVDKSLVPIVDNLTTGGSANVLSAEQGKALKGELTELSAGVSGLSEVINGVVQSSITTEGWTFAPLDKPIPQGATITEVVVENGTMPSDIYVQTSQGTSRDFNVSALPFLLTYDIAKMTIGNVIGAKVTLIWESPEGGISKQISELSEAVDEYEAEISKVSAEIGNEIIYTRLADGTQQFLTPNLTQGQTITSITGVPYLTLYDEQGNNDIIYASQLPYSIKKTYVNWAAYASGTPQCSMIVENWGIKDRLEIVEDKLESLSLELSIPNTIYAVVGDTLQLFYRGMVKAVNPYNYDILVTCDKGNQYPRYFEFTPTSADVGSIPFKVTIKDNNRNVIAEKSCTIKVVNVANSPSSAKKIACFGDSLTAPGTWVAEVYRRLTSTGGTPSANGLTNIDFVGAKTKDGAGYFGVGGWSWTSYTTKGVSAYRFIVSNVGSLSVGAKYTHNGNTFTIMEINVTGGNGNVLCSVDSLTPAPLSSGTLSKSSGSGDDSITFSSYSQDSANPLWDYDNNKMTFIPYANKYADGKLDIVYTLLSWNGLSAGMTDFSSIISKVKTFADTLHAEFPNAKLKIMGLQVPSVNGGMGANYGATGTSYADGYGMVETALNMNKAYQDFANEEGYADFVEFVNISSQFDSEYNMPYANTKVNTRSSLTEKRGNNGVHPSTDGYMQIADVVYRNLMFELRPQEIIYTRLADGTQQFLTPNLTQGQTITSITGVPYLTLYDEQGNNDIIYASQLPYSIKKTYVNWAAYVAGFPEFTMIVE